MESVGPDLANTQLEQEQRADAKRKAKKQRKHEKKRNRVMQGPPRHEEHQPPYKTIVNHRRSYCTNSVLQVPDVVLKMQVGKPRRHLNTQGSRDRRQLFRAAVKARDIKLPRVMHSRYFWLDELVEGFVEATPAKELLDDSRKAAELELWYTIEQGINSRSLREPCMTLKLLFLFCCEMEWSGQRREAFWRRNVELAVRTGAGLFVHEVFDDDKQLIAKAVKWMMQFDLAHDFSPSPCFMRPRHEIMPCVTGDELGCAEEESTEEADSTSVVAQTPIVHSRGRNPLCMQSLRKLVAEMDQLQTPTLQSVLELLGAFDTRFPSPCLIAPPAPLAFDAGVVAACIDILRNRCSKVAYNKKLPFLRKLVDDEDGENDEEEEDPKLRGLSPDDADICGNSVKTNISLLVQQSSRRDSWQMKHLKKFGFFVTKCVPFWYVCVAEALAKMDGRKYEKIFLKLGKRDFSKRWDEKRKISYVVREDELYKLITEPVERMMRQLGLLDVVGKEGVKRVIGDCAALLSLERTVEVLQGMHADTCPHTSWGNNVSFSTITAGSRPCCLEIYPMSWDGGRGPSKVPARVTIPPGHTIVFHGVARHRGVSYPFDCLRFFVSFVVIAAADGAVETTSVVETWQRPEGKAVTFEDWKKKFD